MEKNYEKNWAKKIVKKIVQKIVKKIIQKIVENIEQKLCKKFEKLGKKVTLLFRYIWQVKFYRIPVFGTPILHQSRFIPSFRNISNIKSLNKRTFWK